MQLQSFMNPVRIKANASVIHTKRLPPVDTPCTARVKKELNKSPIDILDLMPKFLRYGPWSPTTYIFLTCCILTMIYQSQYAYHSFPEHTITHDNDIWNGAWRLLLFLYGVATAIHWCNAYSAYWPLASFTIMSWNLYTIRCLFTSLISFGFGSYFLHFMSEILRFPALVCNSITVSIYWIVLVPSMMFFIPSKSAQKAFLKLTYTKAFFVNVHSLNAIFAGFDHLTNPRVLNFFDLYMGIAVAIGYLLVYLFILDPMGLHFYHMLLSPRPHWCTIPYILLLALFPLYLWIWNWITCYIQ